MPNFALVKYVKILFLFLTILASCIEPEKPPANLIPKERMVEILIDLHLSEARVGQFNFRTYDSTKALYSDYEMDIFKKYKVDSAAYNKSYQYYLQNTKMMEDIYTAVVDSLSLRENLMKVD